MKKMRFKIFALLISATFLLLLFSGYVSATEIDRFEYYSTDNGLSHNTVTAVLCDSKGFLWFGTMNGLNRFDGYNFKIMKSKMLQSDEITNNRIVSLLEDKRNFIWFETYDGYYHCFNPRKEDLFTLPKYLVNLEEKSSKITCFHQYSSDEIWLGSSNSGVYRLVYDENTDSYRQEQFLSRGKFSITNNNIRFIVSDKDNNIYIGTKNGLNILKNEDRKAGNFYFQHFFADVNFSSAVSLNDKVWLGTENSGLLIYDIVSKNFTIFNSDNSPLIKNRIDILKSTSKDNLIVGSSDIYIYKPIDNKWITVEVEGDRTDKIFEDSFGVLWVTSGRSGVNKINQDNGDKKHFDLTTDIYKYLSDKERPYFFEDSRKNLWICVHGGGLAQYIREVDNFRFFRNNPSDPKTISSNTVMCITEDHTGTLWVGTSLQGGVNKIIFKNPAFKFLQVNHKYEDFVENIVRSLMEDVNGNLWVATKGGQIKIYDKDFNEISPVFNYPFTPKGELVYNVYAMFQDSKGHIWLGSKGAGIAVSKNPVNNFTRNYGQISFSRFQNIPGDTTSLCDNNIYCIDEDKNGKIWIGTYGGGLCYTISGGHENLKFNRINTTNSNLSNDMIRDLEVDSENNLWVATTFGLNKINIENPDKRKPEIVNYYHDPAVDGSINYNDIVHIYEDSENNMWFGTFGRGVDMLAKGKTSPDKFEHFSEIEGLSNDEVFGIVEDNQGYIWFSTEKGLSRLNKRNRSFEIFNKSNGLTSNEFSENTCLRMKSGWLIFGSSIGIEILNPQKIVTSKLPSKVIFTNFQLFNKEVQVNSPGSPLKEAVTFAEKINLKYNQSSFSFEFSAVNYLDESKTQYAYLLENFDKNWNYVGAGRKATYTNLKPGKYIFKVKAALWDGNWDNEIASIRVNISPPWWGTTLAYIIYLILFLVTSLFVSRTILRINSYRNELKVEKAVNEVKLKFFTNISHEIRTPLTLILGPIEDLLSDKKFPEEFRSPLQLMQKNGNRMLHLLNQLLDFRKVQNKKMILKVEPLDIVSFTKAIYENFTSHARHKGIKFHFTHEGNPDKVWADPHRLDSVIFNVLSNAFKYTPRGKAVNVIVSENTTADEIHVRVKDGGPGIESKDIPLIFNRYSILSDENMTGNSTGIGMNLSNEIVRMHGGEIRVESTIGEGCEFIIVLKKGVSHFQNKKWIQFVNSESTYNINSSIIKDLVPEGEELDGEEESTAPGKHEYTILVVEDNPQILNYVSKSLNRFYNIIEAENGKAGLEKVQEFHPDLIVSDIMMPEIDGIEFTRCLKKDFETCHIPVVLLTAKSGIEDQVLGIESGAEAYVLKPFNTGILKSIIANLLEQRRLLIKRYRENKEIAVSDVKITSRDQEFLEKIIKYIEKNYGDPELSINTLVDYSCVSRTVFYNKVKSLTGLSPIELIRQIKLKISAQMLQNGYNVNEAAMSIGFNDTKYYSRQFKELFGESPSQYKKSDVKKED
ncbi:MAG: response regulator [Prolixibacteraceae bacterium]|nr:response regulator [Prolixibacteraceae bacterium]